MADASVQLQLIVTGADEIRRNIQLIEKAIQAVGGVNGDIKITVDQTSLQEMQRLVSVLKNDLQALNSSLPNKINIDVSDDSIAKLKKAVEQAFIEGLNKSKGRGRGVPVPVPQRGRPSSRPSSPGFGTSFSGDTSEALQELERLSSELNNFSKGLQGSFSRIFADVAPQIKRVRQEIGTETEAVFTGFRQAFSRDVLNSITKTQKEVGRLFVGATQRLEQLQQFAKTIELIDFNTINVTEDKLRGFAKTAQSILSNIIPNNAAEGDFLQRLIGDLDGSVDDIKKVLSTIGPIIQKTVGDFADQNILPAQQIIEQLDISERIVKEQLRLAKATEKNDIRRQARLKEGNRFFAEITTQLQSLLQSNDVGRVQAYLDQWTKFGQKVTADVKSFSQEIDQYQSQLSSIQNQLASLRVAREQENDQLKLSTTLSEVERAELKASVEARTRLIDQLETQERFAQSEITRLQRSAEVHSELSANIRGVANDLRSLARVQEEDDKLVENTQRNVRRLAFQYDSLRAELVALKKDGRDFQDPGRIAEVGAALQRYNTLLTRTGTLIANLDVAEARSLNQLRENFINGADIFARLSAKDANDTFKELEKATIARFAAIRKEVEDTQQSLRTFSLTPSTPALASPDSIFLSADELAKRAKKAAQAANQQLNKIGTQSLNNLKTQANAANTATQQLTASTVQLNTVQNSGTTQQLATATQKLATQQVQLNAAQDAGTTKKLAVATQQLVTQQVQLNNAVSGSVTGITQAQAQTAALTTANSQAVKAVNSVSQSITNVNGAIDSNNIPKHVQQVGQLAQQYANTRQPLMNISEDIENLRTELGKSGLRSQLVRSFIDDIQNGAPRIEQFKAQLSGISSEFLRGNSVVRDFIASFNEVTPKPEFQILQDVFLQVNDAMDAGSNKAKAFGKSIGNISKEKPKVDDLYDLLKLLSGIDLGQYYDTVPIEELGQADNALRKFVQTNQDAEKALGYIREAPKAIAVANDYFGRMASQVEQTNKAIDRLVKKNNELNSSLKAKPESRLPPPPGTFTPDRSSGRSLTLPRPAETGLAPVTVELTKYVEIAGEAVKGTKLLNESFRRVDSSQVVDDVKAVSQAVTNTKVAVDKVGKLDNPFLAMGPAATAVTQRITGLAMAITGTNQVTAPMAAQVVKTTQVLSNLGATASQAAAQTQQLIQAGSNNPTQKLTTSVLQAVQTVTQFTNGAITAKVAVTQLTNALGKAGTQKLLGVTDLSNLNKLSDAMKDLRRDFVSIRGEKVDISNIVEEQDIRDLERYLATSKRLTEIDEVVRQSQRSVKNLALDFQDLNRQFEKRNVAALDTTDLQLAAQEFDALKKRATSAYQSIEKEIRAIQNDIREGLVPQDVGENQIKTLKTQLDLARGAAERFTNDFAPRNFRQSAKVLAKANETVVDLNDTFINAGRTLGGLNERLREGGNATLEAIADYKALIQEINRQKKVADDLLRTYARLEEQGIKLTQTEQKNRDEARRLSAEFGGLAASARKVESEINDLEKETKDSGNAFRLWNKELANSILQNLKFINSMTIVSSFLFGLRTAFTSLIEESKVFARTMTVMTSNSLDFAQIQSVVQKRVRETAIAFGETVQTVAEVVKQFGSAGFSTETSLAALDSTMRTIVATQANAEATTRTLAGIYRVFGDQIRGSGSELQAFKTINDVIISVYRKHQVELDELNQGMKFVASAANAAGFSFQDTSAFLAVLNDNFIKSGAAGRGLQVLFSQFAKNADKFSAAFNIDLDRTKSLDVQFNDILKALNKQFNEGKLSLKDLEKTFKVFGLRGARPFITLVKQYDAVRLAQRELNEEAGDASEALSQIVRASLSKEFESAKQALIDLTRLGVEPLTKAIVVMGNGVKQLRDFFDQSGVAKWGVSIGLVVAGVVAFTMSLLALSQVFITLTASGAKTFVNMLSVGQGLALVARESLKAKFGIGAYADQTNRATIANKTLSGALNENFKNMDRSQKLAIGLGTAMTALFAVGTLAVAFGVFSDGLREVNQEIDRLTVQISNANQNVSKLRKFEDELSKIQSLNQNTLASEQVIGEKIVAAYEQVGQGLSVQAGIISKTTMEVGASADELIQKGLALSKGIKEIQKSIAENAKLLRREAIKQKITLSLDEEGFQQSITRTLKALKSGGISGAIADELGNVDVRSGGLQGFEKIRGAIQAQSAEIAKQKRLVIELEKEYRKTGGTLKSGVFRDLTSELTSSGGALRRLVVEQRNLTELENGLKRLTTASSVYQKQITVFEDTFKEFGLEGVKILREQIDYSEKLGKVSASAAANYRKVIDAIVSRSKTTVKPFSEKELDALANTGELFDDFIRQINAPFDPKVFDSVKNALVSIRKEAEDGKKAFDALSDIAVKTNFKAGQTPQIDAATAGLVEGLDEERTGKVLVEGLTRALGAAAESGKNPGVIRKMLEKEVGQLDQTLSNSQIAEMFVEKFFTKVRKEVGQGGNIVIFEEIDFSAEKLARFGAVISEVTGKGKGGLRDLFATLGNLFKNATIDKQIKQFEILKDNVDDAILSQTSLNKVVGRRQEIQRLSQLVSSAKIAERSFEAVRARYAEIVKERTSLLLSLNNGTKTLTEAEKKRLAELSKEREFYKKNLEDRKQLIIAVKQDRLETQKELNNLRKKNLLTRQAVNDYESGLAKLLQQQEVVNMELKQLPKILRLSEAIVGSRDASRDAISESLEKLKQVAEVQNEIANGIAQEASDRFDTLERIQKLVNPTNKLAGLQEKILGSSVRVARINDQLNQIRGSGIKQEAERLFLWRKLLEEAESLKEAEDKLKKKVKESNKLLSKRAEILKQLRDLFKSDADKFGERLRDIVNAEFQRDVVATAAKIEKLTGIASKFVIPNQKAAVDQLLKLARQGKISLSAFGDEAASLGSRFADLNTESENYNKMLIQLRESQARVAKRGALSAITEEDAKKAQQYLNDYLSKIDEVAQGDSQKREFMLREALRIQERIEKLNAQKIQEIQIKLKLLNSDELLKALKALRDRLSGEITTKINLQLGTENIEKARKQFVDIFAGKAGSSQFNFFNNKDLIAGFKKNTDRMQAAFKNLESTFMQFRVFTRRENESLKRVMEDLKNKIGGQLVRAVPGFMKGGHINGYGGGDQVPSLLEQGEYVIPKEIVRMYGKAFFDKLRQGRIDRFRDGGQKGDVKVAIGTGEARNPAFKAKIDINPPIWPQLPTDSLVIANREFAKTIAVQKKSLESVLGQLKGTDLAKEISKALERTKGKETKVQAKELAKVLSSEFKEKLSTVLNSVTPRASTADERRRASIREFKPATDFAKEGADILKRSPIAKAILDSIRKAIQDGQEEINKFLFGFLVPQFAIANTRAFEALLQKIDDINKQFEATIKAQQTSLRRNQTDYFSYLNSIEDAERQRIESRIAAEEEYRKQLVKTKDVFAKAAQEGASAALDAVSKVSKSILGGISDSLFGTPEENINQLVGQFKDAFEKINFRDIVGKGLDNVLDKAVGKIFVDTGIAENIVKGLDKIKGIFPKDFFGGLRGDFLDVFGEIGDLLGNTIFASIQGGFGFITSGIGSLIGLTAGEDNGRTTVRFIERFISELPTAADKFISQLTENAGRIIEAVAQGAPAIIDVLVTKAPQFLQTFVDILSGSLPQIVESIAGALPKLVTNFAPVLSNLIKLLIRQIPTLIGGLAEALPLLIGEIIKNLPFIIFEAAKAVVKGVIELVKGLFKGIGGFFKGLTKFHTGGMIGGKTDEVLIMAQRGEGILSRKGIDAIGGPRVLKQFNDGENPFVQGTFHDGGIIGDRFSGGVGSGTTNNVSNREEVNVNVTANFSGGSLEDNKKANDDLTSKIDRMLSQRSRDRRSRYNSDDKT